MSKKNFTKTKQKKQAPTRNEEDESVVVLASESSKKKKAKKPSTKKKVDDTPIVVKKKKKTDAKRRDILESKEDVEDSPMREKKEMKVVKKKKAQKYFTDFYDNINIEALRKALREGRDWKSKEFALDWAHKKAESRLAQLKSLRGVNDVEMLEAFDQMVELFGEEAFHRGINEGITNRELPDINILALGGACATISRHWVDYMANPDRPYFEDTFGSTFSPFIALNEERERTPKSDLVMNYDKELVDSSGGALGIMASRLTPCFSMLTEVSMEIERGLFRTYKEKNLTRKQKREQKEQQIKEVAKFWADFLPNVDDEDDNTGRYMLIKVQGHGTSHLIAIAKPAANMDEYHMFDPNSGHFRGEQKGCYAWLRAQFQDTYTEEDGWGKIYQTTLEYDPDQAIDSNGRSKHYVQYITP